MTEELKPCPFCGGGTNEIRENGRIWVGHGWGEPSSVSVIHHCELIVGQPNRGIERIGRDRESAISMWNMRANVKLRGSPASGESRSNAGLGVSTLTARIPGNYIYLSRTARAIFKAPYFFVFNCYDLLAFIYLNLKFRYLSHKLCVLSLQCSSGKKMLQPVEHKLPP